jgi:O-antigen/teichoic acid export membrane protein
VEIRKKVLTSLRWTATARFLGQLISWAITIVVIRVLSPADYGLMAMATVFLSFLYLVNTLGLDAVLVQREQLDEFTRRQVFGIVIVVNSAFFLSLFLAAPLIAAFFGESRLGLIVKVLSAQFLLLIFETLPQSQLEREIDFKRMSVVDLATMIVGSLITLTLAFVGMGVWALVWGHLATITSRMIGLNLISRCLCWPSFSLRGFQDSMSFGGYVTLDRVLWFFFAETDKFIGGKLLGKELLGYYAVANHLALLPVKKLAGLINAIAFPAFARVQTEPAQVRSYLLKAVRLMSFVSFPVFLGVASVAAELVEVLLGEKWRQVGLLLQILAFVMPMRMIATVLPPALWGVGRPDVSATNFLIAALIMPVAYYLGAHAGVVGLALAWLVAYPLVFIISVARTCRVLGIAARAFFGSMTRPAAASFVMLGMVLAAKGHTFDDLGIVVQLLQLVAIGCIAYATIVLAWHRDGLREAWDLLRR